MGTSGSAAVLLPMEASSLSLETPFRHGEESEEGAGR